MPNSFCTFMQRESSSGYHSSGNRTTTPLKSPLSGSASDIALFLQAPRLGDELHEIHTILQALAAKKQLLLLPQVPKRRCPKVAKRRGPAHNVLQAMLDFLLQLLAREPGKVLFVHAPTVAECAVDELRGEARHAGRAASPSSSSASTEASSSSPSSTRMSLCKVQAEDFSTAAPCQTTILQTLRPNPPPSGTTGYPSAAARQWA